ncbi:Spliceosome subunit [Phytophthora cinnamomi]|uniref:Spliceosome subunit n=1 Tax=Phytophthora cinnamomi TaxID=4785 RepID=UPI00355A781E|nr:Spliceosome subunit [Phytophthora cinnamomi]
MEAQRALLDSLMGVNRDGDRPDDDPQLDFRHPRVCKPFLCGLCPRELFQNTRVDAGACALLHSPSIRAAYEQQGARRFGYERALAAELSWLLADVERKIAKAQRRLDEDDADADRARLTQELQDKARDGDADAALRLVERAELLKRQRRELLRQSQEGGADAKQADGGQKLRVCDVCGAFLSIFDSERRLADHFGGKVHVGYVQVRVPTSSSCLSSSTAHEEARCDSNALTCGPGRTATYES